MGVGLGPATSITCPISLFVDFFSAGRPIDRFAYQGAGSFLSHL
jgi:hypothetical protein